MLISVVGSIRARIVLLIAASALLATLPMSANAAQPQVKEVIAPATKTVSVPALAIKRESWVTNVEGAVTGICVSPDVNTMFVSVSGNQTPPVGLDCATQQYAAACPGMWIAVDLSEPGGGVVSEQMQASYLSGRIMTLRLYRTPSTSPVSGYCSVGVSINQ